MDEDQPLPRGVDEAEGPRQGPGPGPLGLGVQKVGEEGVSAKGDDLDRSPTPRSMSRGEEPLHHPPEPRLLHLHHLVGDPEDGLLDLQGGG